MFSPRQTFNHRPSGSLVDIILDCSATLACWAWFTLGFILFFSWRYLIYALRVKNPEIHFQRLNSLFYRGFFRILSLTAPRQKIEIDTEAASIKSSVIICNHLSYLDPLLLISLFPQHRTIVKARFFGTPVFGWIITKSGYIPASGEGGFSRLMVNQMETMEQYLKDGGNLFIFPEGTRSRNGKIGELNKGAFKIARMCSAPLYVLQIRNTDRLFTPGRFIFNTRVKNTITVRTIKHIPPDRNASPSISGLLQQVRQVYISQQEKDLEEL